MNKWGVEVRCMLKISLEHCKIFFCVFVNLKKRENVKWISVYFVGVSPGNVGQKEKKTWDGEREEEWRPRGGFVLLVAYVQSLIIRLSNGVRKLSKKWEEKVVSHRSKFGIFGSKSNRKMGKFTVSLVSGGLNNWNRSKKHGNRKPQEL